MEETRHIAIRRWRKRALILLTIAVVQAVVGLSLVLLSFLLALAAPGRNQPEPPASEILYQSAPVCWGLAALSGLGSSICTACWWRARGMSNRV